MPWAKGMLATPDSPDVQMLEVDKEDEENKAIS